MPTYIDTSDTLSEARGVSARYPVRTVDALHLATAIGADQRLRPAGLHMRFCTADAQQAAAARGLFGASEVDFVPPWR